MAIDIDCRCPVDAVIRSLSFAAPKPADRWAIAAASVLVAAPIVIVYIFLQRHFIRGMLAGAVKG